MEKFIQGLPQIVPEEWCLNCKICCRFPAEEGVQAPTWSVREAQWAVQAGGEKDWFEQKASSPSLLPRLHTCGSGFRCPAFESKTNRCSIYSVRPLDCRLYPFVLTKNPGDTQVLLAMDLKCPYLQAHGSDPEVSDYALSLARYLEASEGLEYLKENPQIVGPSWPEFVPVAALPSLTAAVQGMPLAPHPALRPLTREEIPLLKSCLSMTSHQLSSYTLAGLLGWSDLIHYWWVLLKGALCLFAEQGGGLSMPLPPLAQKVTVDVCEAAWAILEEANQGERVSRVEGVEPLLAEQLKSASFEWAPGEPEYLYRREDLAALRGDRYHSQRGAANRFLNTVRSYRFRPFEEKDLVACLQLYTRWGIRRQQQESAEPWAKAFIRDGLFFHRRLMMDRQELGLTGRVLEAENGILGYTFGAPVSRDVFCVFLEIADRDYPGAAQLLFRELCREMDSFPLINGMGDSDLQGLRRVKEGYRPVGMASAAKIVGRRREWS